jgi:hypothetical protein
MRIGGIPGLLPSRRAVGQPFPPHLFEIVVRSDLGPKQMHDHVARIDQHPVTLGCACHRDPHPLRQRLFEMLGQCQHLAGRTASGDHHLIGDRRLAGELDGDDVLGLAVVESLQDELEEFARSRGRGARRRAAAGREGCDRGQMGLCSMKVWDKIFLRPVRIPVAERGSSRL